MKICELDPAKVCDDCGECLICDLDPDKVCDNCCECLGESEYQTVRVDRIIFDDESDILESDDDYVDDDNSDDDCVDDGYGDDVLSDDAEDFSGSDPEDDDFFN